jgi:DNA-directed RNA polymerase subunit M/transcription elongation factor TFIIS
MDLPRSEKSPFVIKNKQGSAAQKRKGGLKSMAAKRIAPQPRKNDDFSEAAQFLDKSDEAREVDLDNVKIRDMEGKRVPKSNFKKALEESGKVNAHMAETREFVSLSTDALIEFISRMAERSKEATSFPAPEREMMLRSLEYVDGKKLIVSEFPDVAYEFASSVVLIGFDATFMYYSDAIKRKKMRADALILASPLFGDIKNRERDRILLMSKKIKLEKGLFPCPKCKSPNTYTILKQKRSIDEGMSAETTCMDCKHEF